MKRLSAQSYVTTRREIKGNKQLYIEKEQTLQLYENRIFCETHQFSIHDVHDISYRPLSAQYGFLYLHTIKGVFTFQVKTNPEHFIKEYKRLK